MNPMPKMKNGFLTSEFWAMSVVVVGVSWTYLSGHIPPDAAAATVTIATAVYTGARSWLKAKHAAGDLPDVADLPDAGKTGEKK